MTSTNPNELFGDIARSLGLPDHIDITPEEYMLTMHPVTYKTILAWHTQQLKTIRDEVEAERQDEHPTEDGVPVETYGYEATHNEALKKALTIIDKYSVANKEGEDK